MDYRKELEEIRIQMGNVAQQALESQVSSKLLFMNVFSMVSRFNSGAM